jgi:hypothetical protein
MTEVVLDNQMTFCHCEEPTATKQSPPQEAHKPALKTERTNGDRLPRRAKALLAMTGLSMA